MTIQPNNLVNDFKTAVLDAIEILKLNKTKIETIKKDKNATKFAWIFLVAPGLLKLVILSTMYGYSSFYLHEAIWCPIGIIGMIYVSHFIAMKFFNGKGKLEEYFRVIGYVNALQLITIIILLLGLLRINLTGLSNLVLLIVSIYSIVLFYKLLKESYQLTTTHTIITIILAVIGVSIVISIFDRNTRPAHNFEDFNDVLNYAKHYSHR